MLNIPINAPALENVGNVTITDGVATGFTSSKFLQTAVQLDTTLPDYEICCKFSCTNSNNDNPIIRFLNAGGINIQVVLGKIVLFLLYKGDAENTRYDTNHTIASNQIYSLIFKRTGGTKYSVFVGVGNEPATNEIWNITNSRDIGNDGKNTVTFGGGRSDLTTQYLGGSIYLEGTLMFENKELVAGQMIDREPPQIIVSKGTTPTETGPVAINTVGTLTVNDGVVTGFNATSNYLQCAQKFDFTKANYEIACKFKSTSSTNTTWIFGQGGLTLCLGSGTDANKVEAYITLETSGYAAYKQLFTTTLNNIWSLIFRRTDGTRYDLFVTDSSGLRQLIKTWNTTENIASGDSSNILRFGGGNTYNQYLTGELYLKGTYATVDNELWAGQFDDGYMLTDANYLIVDDKLVWANSNIYIDVSNEPTNPTKFVRTNITLNSNSKVEMVFKPSQYSSNYALWCCRNDLQIKTLSIFNVAGNYRFDYYTSQTSIGSSTSLTKTNITADGNKAYVDGTLKATVTAQTFTPDYGMVLFASNTSGGTTYNNGYQGKFYSMKIYLDGTNLSYHFVPVPSGLTIGSYTTPSAGMFDIVNQQFYANSGSGTFTWGKDN